MQKSNETELKFLLKKTRRRNLEKKFLKDTKEVIFEETIKEMIEKLQLQRQYDKESVRLIFEELDKSKSGRINVDEFLESLSERFNSKTYFHSFYNLILQEITGKSEKIIQRLKKIKQKLSNDSESIEDIEWIISSICDSDIYEPESSEISKFTQQLKVSSTSSIGTDYNRQYSQVSVKDPKEHGLLKMSSDCEDKRPNYNISDFKTIDAIPQNVLSAVKANLDNIENFDYNIFDLDDLLDKQTITHLSLEIFRKFKFFEEGLLKEDKYNNFIKEVTNGYDRNVTYHNDLHAADVLQTTYVIIQRGFLKTKLQLQKIDLFGTMVSAIIHDFKHPGLNNMYHINARTKYAMRYNDISVLENYHVSQAFKLMNSYPSCNILDSLSPDDYRLTRRRIIECILATDMGNHTKTLASLKSRVDTFDIKSGRNIERMIFPENLSKTFENQQIVLSMIIHSADISNPAKPEHVQKTWVDLIFIEFFKQGDLETKQNLPISLLCDRKTTNIDKSQIGFMNFIIIPTFESLLNIVPEIYPYTDYLKSNLKKYEQLANQK